jgi:hypothetical protein
LMFNFRGRGEAKLYHDRRIEVQIRTRLQHAWATAVESVGLFRGEDLKSNQGNADWLELFRLMSAEFAVAEGCPEPPNVPDHNERVWRIKDLDKSLDAARTLENITHAVRGTDFWIISPYTRYFLIRYDNATNQVSVAPYSRTPVQSLPRWPTTTRKRWIIGPGKTRKTSFWSKRTSLRI